MSKKRELALKIIIIMGVILGVIFIYFGIKMDIAKRHNAGAYITYKRKTAIFSGLYCFDGLLIMILGSAKLKNIKPKKYILKQLNYEEFSNYLSKRVKEYGYEDYYNNENIKIYKREIKKKIYYIIDARIEELTELNFDELYNKQVFKIIEEDFNKMQYKWYQLYVTFIISVDRITPMFNKFVNVSEIDKRFNKFSVGISFGGNRMYMADNDFCSCKKLEKEFKEIMKVSE